MQPPEPYLIFTRKLQELGLRHMVSGSIAAIYYGEPRLTNDVDIIVFLRREDVRRLITAFPQDEFYCPPVEVIERNAHATNGATSISSITKPASKRTSTSPDAMSFMPGDLLMS